MGYIALQVASSLPDANQSNLKKERLRAVPPKVSHYSDHTLAAFWDTGQTKMIVSYTGFVFEYVRLKIRQVGDMTYSKLKLLIAHWYTNGMNACDVVDFRALKRPLTIQSRRYHMYPTMMLLTHALVVMYALHVKLVEAHVKQHKKPMARNNGRQFTPRELQLDLGLRMMCFRGNNYYALGWIRQSPRKNSGKKSEAAVPDDPLQVAAAGRNKRLSFTQCVPVKRSELGKNGRTPRRICQFCGRKSAVHECSSCQTDGGKLVQLCYDNTGGAYNTQGRRHRCFELYHQKDRDEKKYGEPCWKWLRGGQEKKFMRPKDLDPPQPATPAASADGGVEG